MPEFNVIPLSKTLLVEGTGRKEPFRGLVLAIGWFEEEGGRRRALGPPAPPDLHYLISDESRPAPIWAEARHIASQQWFPAAGRGGSSS